MISLPQLAKKTARSRSGVATRACLPEGSPRAAARAALRGSSGLKRLTLLSVRAPRPGLQVPAAIAHCPSCCPLSSAFQARPLPSPAGLCSVLRGSRWRWDALWWLAVEPRASVKVGAFPGPLAPIMTYAACFQAASSSGSKVQSPPCGATSPRPLLGPGHGCAHTGTP